MPLTLPLMRGGGLHFHVMLCWRGLRTAHIHRPLTTYFLGAKIGIFLLLPKLFNTISAVLSQKRLNLCLRLKFFDKDKPELRNFSALYEPFWPIDSRCTIGMLDVKSEKESWK